MQVAALDPFRGYHTALTSRLEHASAVLDPFYDDVLVMPTWGGACS